MSDNLQVESLDFMIDEIDDTSDVLLERMKRLDKFRSKASNTAHKEADGSRFTETEIFELIITFYPFRLSHRAMVTYLLYTIQGTHYTTEKHKLRLEIFSHPPCSG